MRKPAPIKASGSCSITCIMTIRNTYALLPYTSEPKEATENGLQFWNSHMCTTHTRARPHTPPTHVNTPTTRQAFKHKPSKYKQLVAVCGIFKLTLLYKQFSKWYISEVRVDGVVQSVDICLCTCRGKVKVVVMDGIHLARQQLIQHSNQHSIVYT